MVGQAMELGGLLKNPPDLYEFSDEVMANVVEAVVGAVWVDSGMRVQSIKGVLRSLWLMNEATQDLIYRAGLGIRSWPRQ